MLSNKFTSSSMILNDSNTKTFVSYVSQNMRKASIDHQLLLLNSNRKLCFYTLFKTDTTKTDSLDAIKNPFHRTAINRFLLGNHQLHIETGRHTVPKTPEKLRICTLICASLMMLRMNLMFCSLAHFIIISDQIFLTKLLENINSLKTEL